MTIKIDPLHFDDAIKYPRIGRRKLSHKLKISEHEINGLVARGIVTQRTDRTGKNFIIESEATEQITAYLAGQMPHRKVKDNAARLNKAKAEKEEYAVKTARIKYEKELGRLVDIDVMKHRLYELALLVKESMLNIPNKISPEITSMTDEREVNLALDAEIREALTNLSNEFLDKLTDTEA